MSTACSSPAAHARSPRSAATSRRCSARRDSSSAMRSPPWSTASAFARSRASARRLAPEVDLRKPRVAERLVHLGDVIDVVGEDALDHRAARVLPCLVPLVTANDLVERVQGPSIQTPLDDAECRVESRIELVRVQDGFEVVVARAVVAGVGEWSGLRAWFASEIAEPENALARRVADRRPHRPSLG